MRQLVKVEEVEGEGLFGLLGKVVTLFCMNYFYTGTLVGVNESFVKLAHPKIVYETGSYTDKAWKTAEQLPNDLYVMLASIEAFGMVK